MNHWLLAPILVPAATAVTLLLTSRADRSMHRAFSVLATLGLVGVAIYLNVLAFDGTRHVYALGDWPIPFGIVVVLDKLSALMVLLTSVVAFGAILYAVNGWDERGRNFHALFQFQLMGLCGAFLTGDIFNLFVFFEILLIASYALLLHGGGAARVKAGLHYVVINLTGSALFLIGLGMVYSAFGSLNMADIAVRASSLSAGELPLAQSAFRMLLVVFAIKAAALPLYFWLPSTYGAASAPVASLFAIMTKVGLYAIVRVSTLMLGPDAGALAGLGQSLVLWGGVATAVAAALGVLSSRDLRAMAAYLVIASVGLLMIAFGLGTTEGLEAGVYYLVHSTIVMAGFFLLAENLGSRRGPLDTALTSGPAFPGLGVVGVMYFAYAIAAVGLPPLSGFVGKFFVLRAAVATPWAATLFVVILGAGLLALIAAGRAGTVLFWRTSDASESHTLSAKRSPLAPALIHLAIAVALVAAAGPALRFATGVASQLVDASGYIDAVMSHVSIGRS